MTRLVFVTSNEGKAREAEQLLGTQVEAVSLELPELQTLSFEEVVRGKAVEAARLTGRRVLVEDSGLELRVWKGYPGPFTKWITNHIDDAALARMLDPFEDRSAEAVAVVGIAEPGQRPDEVLVAEGRIRGSIAAAPRGSSGFGWDVLFIPEGESRTWAEMTVEEKLRDSHRSRAFAALAKLLG